MNKLKQIFGGHSDKDATSEVESSAESHGKSELESEARSATTGTGSSSNTAGGASSYAREAEQELTSHGASSERTGASSETYGAGSSGLMSSNDTAGYTGPSGNIPRASSTASIKSGVPGTDLSGMSDSAGYTAQPSMGAGSGAGLTGTAFTDRSVGAGSSGNYTETLGSSAGRAVDGPHETFTGNRLDPAYTEPIPTYHEEVAGVHQFQPSGQSVLGPTGIAATYTISGAEAEQYRNATSISTVGYNAPSAGYRDQSYNESSTITGGQGFGITTGSTSNNDNTEIPSAVRRYEENTGTYETPTAQHGTGATAGAAGAANVYAQEYPARADLEHHEELEDRDRKQSKGGLLGVLHSSQRDKYDDPAERDTTAREKYFGQHSRDASRDVNPATGGRSQMARDVGIVGTTGALGTAAYEYEQSREPISTTTTTGAGYYDPTANEASTGPNGFAVGLTGDNVARTAIPTTTTTSTTYAAAPAPVVPVHATEAVPEKKHHFGFLHRKDKDVKPLKAADELNDGRVIDSVTGLPMNVAKYGYGTGGTDGERAIHGYEKNLNVERLETEGTADYQAIKKANTPY